LSLYPPPPPPPPPPPLCRVDRVGTYLTEVKFQSQVVL
jgi:hypothetical protein